MNGQLLQVVLPEMCVRFGGDNEYPDGLVGQEAVPARIVDEVARTKADTESDVSLQARTQTAYEESGPRVHERLRYVRFAEHFDGEDDRGRRQRKTDNRKGMWIPECLLVPVPEVSEAVAN